MAKAFKTGDNVVIEGTVVDVDGDNVTVEIKDQKGDSRHRVTVKPDEIKKV